MSANIDLEMRLHKDTTDKNFMNKLVSIKSAK